MVVGMEVADFIPFLLSSCKLLRVVELTNMLNPINRGENYDLWRYA